MSTTAYAHDIGETIYFATKNGVKSGVVKAVHIVIEGAETYPHAPVTIVTYSCEVPNVGRSSGGPTTHRESVPELLAAASLTLAYGQYLELVAA